jgi:hypothetical protein
VGTLRSEDDDVGTLPSEDKHLMSGRLDKKVCEIPLPVVT